MLNKTSKLAAEILIDLKCINFSPKKQFKLTSGKVSPVYCDCRRLISFPNERKKLIDLGVKLIKAKLNSSKISNIAGGESAGIPFSAFIASKLNLPMVYIRKEKKRFGKNSQIEGILKKKDRVILVEDLMTDGGSKLNFLNAINSVGAKIEAIFVIFNYGIINDFYNFQNKKVKIIQLTNWNHILDAATKKKILNPQDIKIIKNFLLKMSVKN